MLILDNLEQEYKSFPSGHALTTFLLTTYVALYIGIRIGVADGNRQVHITIWNCVCEGLCFVVTSYLIILVALPSQLWKLSFSLLPTMFALYTSVARIPDYAHAWDDVLVGALIGIVGGFFGFTMAFDWEGAPRVRRR